MSHEPLSSLDPEWVSLRHGPRVIDPSMAKSAFQNIPLQTDGLRC